jgi:iron complex outermembrane receptor protein
LDENLSRRLWAILVQDQYAFNDRLTITAGLRFDSYDDVGDATSPRIAAVYQLTGEQTLKAQFARAFRPPTFLETSTKNNPVVTGSPNIESETINNYELGYIYNDGVSVARATLFYGALKELIVIDTSASPNVYTNNGKVDIVGTELEYSRKFNKHIELDSNITVQKAEDENNSKPVVGVASVLANVGMIYRVDRQYSIAGQYRYVGERSRAESDLRDDLAGYQTVDVTVTMKHLFEHSAMEGAVVRAGIKNLFDADVVYAAPLTNFNGVEKPSYADDYPRPGREYWLQMAVRF